VLQLSDVQLAFLQVLWAEPGATTQEVRAGLAARGRELAPTTVSTVLARLEKKGIVAHGARGRQFHYRALVTEQDVRHSVLDRVTQGLFDGDVAALVSHLLDQKRVSPDELAQVLELIEGRESDDRDD
jgi:BlaI family penicillinase repressor